MDAIKTLLSIADIFFITYLAGYSTFLLLSVIVGVVDLSEKRKNEKMKSQLYHDLYIPISILVPAHNEEQTIVDTVRSLLEQDYPLFEIIVVNDGSTDQTAALMIDYFQMHEISRPIRRVIPCKQESAIYEAVVQGTSITLVCKENGGKADSLNMGINISSYPYFVCMDADSMLQKNSLYEIIKPVVENDDVIACGGKIAVSNGIRLEHGEVLNYSIPKQPLAAMQVLEYERSFLASRIFLNQFNGNLIISGAFGLFKKETVILAGGYDPTTMGEDMELVLRLHVFCRANRIKYSIEYTPDAICWSQVPSSLPDLIRQRRRWHIGMFESLRRHWYVLGKKEYGLMGTISFLYFWIYELCSPFIEIFGLITIVLSFAVNLLNLPFFIFFLSIYTLFACILTLTSFFTRHYMQKMRISFLDSIKAVILCGFELLGLRFILMFARLNALLFYKKKKNVWGSLKRQKHHID